MGLTNSSTGNGLLHENFEELRKKSSYTIALAGNPNVGKSTIFNSLTGLNQHTGNWPGKTVSSACGLYTYNKKNFLLVDLPGTYSLMSNSQEEEIARDYICFDEPDATLVVVDATCLERNLNLVYQVMELTNKVIVCINLLDEAEKHGIKINLKRLSEILGVPVVGTTARKPKMLKKLLSTIDDVCSKRTYCSPISVKYHPTIENSIELISTKLKDVILPTNEDYSHLYRWLSVQFIVQDLKILNTIENQFNIDTSKFITLLNFKHSDLSKNRDLIVSSIVFRAEDVANDVCSFESLNHRNRDRKIDKILTSKTLGFPIMLLLLGLVFWLTIVGANYPSTWLSNLFSYFETKLFFVFDFFNSPAWLKSLFINGIYCTLTWIIAVMLPPMAIFFPLFTFLEDLGVLPRIAFNLDNYFKKGCTSGKQSLTMCMGFGCNAAGVVGCRIIDSEREKLIAILTNSFVPCNGRFPLLITIATAFVACYFTGILSTVFSALTVLAIILLGIFLTLIISKILSKTILKGTPSSFILELPPYRKPQLSKILVRSLIDRTLFVLLRAIYIAIPAGILIWAFANIYVGGSSILFYIASFLNPFAKLIGLDGYILAAFILAIPANEIVLPILLMGYLSSSTLISLDEIHNLKSILISNGWSILTAINVMIFSLLHFPCSTTLLTIKKETNSWKWAGISFLLPTVCGIVVCLITSGIYNLINFIIS